VMNSTRIKGNLLELPKVPKRAGKHISRALRNWTIGDIGEVIGFWVLHKAGFWRIVKPFLLQCRNGDKIVNISSFISPNQIRQGICLLPTTDERYYKDKILTEEQMKSTHRWDFLALRIRKRGGKIKAYPCLIDVKTQRSKAETSEDYRLFKKRDFSREKEIGFKILCLRIILSDDWYFEAKLEEL